MNKMKFYGIQVGLVCSIAIASNCFDDKKKWINVARYVIYLLTVKSIPPLVQLLLKWYSSADIDLQRAVSDSREYALAYVSSAALLVYCGERVLHEDFVFVALAYLVVKYPEMVRSSLVAIVSWTKQPSINYGVGMACSFFEGYLMHILPSDGARFVGFEENIRILEDKEGVYFPVKKLFIIITKNLFCPPDLKEFNKGMDKPHLEAFNSLEDIIKNVAGVRNRSYRNTAYKIYRSPAPAVCLAAECATPLHTLYKVLNNRSLYKEVADIETGAVVQDFCRTLRAVLAASAECRGQCELLYYDNEDPEQNLSEILLKRIEQLAPDFEAQIVARRAQNYVHLDDGGGQGGQGGLGGRGEPAG